MFALLLCEADDSGVRQAFGPFTTRADAEQAQTTLAAWPTLPGPGPWWRIMPLTEFGSTAPDAVPVFPPPVAYPPGIRPWEPVLPALPRSPAWEPTVVYNTQTSANGRQYELGAPAASAG